MIVFLYNQEIVCTMVNIGLELELEGLTRI